MAVDNIVIPRLRRLDRMSVYDRSRGFAGTAIRSAAFLLEGSEVVLRMLSLMLAMLATSAFLITDADGGRSEPGLWLQIVVESLLAVCLWRLLRYLPEHIDRGTLTAVAAICVLVLSLLWEPVQRMLLGTGRPFEMLLMHSQKNLMLLLAAAGQRGGMRMSVFIGAVLCIFSSAITRDPRAWLATALFAVTGLSWLVAAYWSGLRPRMLRDSGSRMPLRWALAGPLCGLLLLAAAGGGGPQVISTIRGFLPGSGGDGEYDEFSRGGVNDGDALVAGLDDIRSFGAIEDAPFAESDRPSLYDVINDAFDEPVRRNKTTQRAVALPPELMASLQQRLSSVQEAGREFSTHRRHSSSRKARARSISSATLISVSGRVPLHLRMELYDLFDGRDWQALPEPEESLRFSTCDHAGKPWIRIPASWRGLHFESYSDYHIVTPLGLKSPIIPAPADARALHIDRVDQPDMFAWHQEGIVRMVRDSLEPQAAIHLRSEVADPQKLRRNPGLHFETTRSAECRLLPGGAGMERIGRLAAEWAGGLPRGMAQVDEICRRLREGYVLDRDVLPDETSELPVEDFLFQLKRGPEYLFATSAVVMLRSLGYTARLVSGFYANPQNYDARKRKTLVRAEDSHFWCEVFVGGGTWATLEPSPGYALLEPPPTLGQRIAAFLRWGWRRAVQHWLWVLTGAVLLALAWVQRRHIQCAVRTVIWRVFPGRGVRERVLRATRLVDSRLRLAGLARPAHLSPARWLDQLSPLSAPTAQRLLHLAESAMYGGGAEFAGISTESEVSLLNAALLRELNFKGLQRLAREKQQALSGG
jgi:transglutaminase-like putative cysteine protease